MKRSKRPSPCPVKSVGSHYWMHIPSLDGSGKGQYLARISSDRLLLLRCEHPLDLSRLEASMQLHSIGSMKEVTFLAEVSISLPSKQSNWVEGMFCASSYFDLRKGHLVLTIEGLCELSTIDKNSGFKTVSMPLAAHQRALPVFARIYLGSSLGSSGGDQAIWIKVQRSKNLQLMCKTDQTCLLEEGSFYQISTKGAFHASKNGLQYGLREKQPLPFSFSLGSFCRINPVAYPEKQLNKKLLKAYFSALFDFWQLLTGVQDLSCGEQDRGVVPLSSSENLTPWQMIALWKSSYRDHFVLSGKDSGSLWSVEKFISIGRFFLQQWVQISHQRITLKQEGPRWSTSGQLWGLRVKDSGSFFAMHLHWKKNRFHQVELELSRESDSYTTTIDFGEATTSQSGPDRPKARLHIKGKVDHKALEKSRNENKCTEVHFPYTLTLCPGQSAIFDRFEGLDEV